MLQCKASMYIRVHVITSAKRESVQAEKPDVLNISVKEPAENNRANVRVRELVALRYAILPKDVRIIGGHHHTSKILLIPDSVDL